jgi:hypothetical protein
MSDGSCNRGSSVVLPRARYCAIYDVLTDIERKPMFGNGLIEKIQMKRQMLLIPGFIA